MTRPVIHYTVARLCRPLAHWQKLGARCGLSLQKSAMLTLFFSP